MSNHVESETEKSHDFFRFLSSGRPKARQRQSAWAARRGVANDAGADGCATEVTALQLQQLQQQLCNSTHLGKMVKDGERRAFLVSLSFLDIAQFPPFV